MALITRPRRRRASSRLHLHLESLEVRSMLDAAGGLVATQALETVVDSYARSHVLVRFRDEAVAAGRIRAFAPGTTLGGQVGSVPGLYQIDVAPGVAIGNAIDAYRASSDVLYAQPDYALAVDRLPNDPSFGSLYGLNNTGQSGGTADADIDAPEAWDINTGSGNVVVAVIDTGVDYNHPDLAANIWANTAEVAGDGIDNDGNGYVDDLRGWDFVNNDNNPMDDNGHGTHVAGTIGAVGNNGIGVAGVNWRVKLMPLKFLSASGSGSTSGAIAALDYARVKGAKIANNSWGGGGFNQALSDAITRYRNAGGIFVAAAGNDGRNNDSTPNYPSNYSQDNIVAVAATDRNDRLASYSNYGVTTVDIAAPGSAILSTTPNNTYSTYSGTSMATPQVAGALALVWDTFPTLTYKQVIDRVLNNTDAILLGSVAKGRLNVYKALTAGTTTPGDTAGPKVTSAVWAGSSSSISGVRLTFSEAIDPASFTAADLALTTPSGTSVAIGSITPVSGSNNTQFDVAFASQTAGGTYRLVVGPAINDAAGNAMDQDGDNVLGEATQDQFASTVTVTPTSVLTYNWSGGVDLADRTITTLSFAFPNAATIDDLNIKVGINHTYDSDLVISLVSPAGVSVTLFNRRGGSGDNIQATFDDEATTLIRSGVAPFNGTYRPEGLLSAFDGSQAQGTWRLVISDRAAGDVGSLTSLTMTVTPRATVQASGVGSMSPMGPIAPTPTPAVPSGPAVTAAGRSRQAASKDAAVAPSRTGTLDPVLTVPVSPPTARPTLMSRNRWLFGS